MVQRIAAKNLPDDIQGAQCLRGIVLDLFCFRTPDEFRWFRNPEEKKINSVSQNEFWQKTIMRIEQAWSKT